MDRSKTVVLADYNEDNRMINRTILEHFGYDVLEVRNGEDALRVAREDHPALMVIRRMLPLVDGWDVARILKGDPATSGIPLIGMSANGLPHDVAAAEEAGCDVFLAAPCEPRRLIAEVERLIGTARAPAAQDPAPGPR